MSKAENFISFRTKTDLANFFRNGYNISSLACPLDTDSNFTINSRFLQRAKTLLPPVVGLGVGVGCCDRCWDRMSLVCAVPPVGLSTTVDSFGTWAVAESLRSRWTDLSR